MAYVEKFEAGIQSGDQTGQKRSAAVRVSPANARLWFAAADHAARQSTAIGLMLNSLNDAQSSDGTPGIYEYYVTGHDINDAYAKPAVSSNIYNSNSIKLTYATTNAGVPVTESIYIPQRLASLTLNPDGKSYNIAVSPFVVMNTNLIAGGLSSYGTPITGIVEAIPNDV